MSMSVQDTAIVGNVLKLYFSLVVVVVVVVHVAVLVVAVPTYFWCNQITIAM